MGRSTKMAFVGLAADVRDIVGRLEGVTAVTCTKVRSAHGHPKVKIPERWPEPRLLPIVVSDRDNGEREIEIRANKAAAVARILAKRLRAQGIAVIA